jgi:putative acyl-CoA dehydrogenase
MKDFYQNGPQISNTYHSDPLLSGMLKRLFPADLFKVSEAQLQKLGERAASEMLNWANDAEAHPPVHVPYSPWGKRIDEIQTSPGWKALEALASTEGIVATAYDRKWGAFSRVYQMALLYLYSPSSAICSCPMAMTDGAARALELFAPDELKARALPHLLSREPQNFWTAGQWMTERSGGSDVSGTATLATPTTEPSEFGATHVLHGVKWFTSATTSQMALTLARTPGAPEGSRGLSLFYLELRDENQNLKNIQIHRLKDKLGTKALPTAELSLQGTPARLIGKEGEGVKRIAAVLNITRIYNSICAVGHSRRALDLAQDYSKKRDAFGKRLIDHPLHAKTLSDLENEFRKSFSLAFFVAHLLGKEEVGEIRASEKVLLRLLTPIAKLYTAKKTLRISSEVVEIFGGAGYVEDTGIPRLLRDGQVFSIWEGTTNVLALDMLRAFEKENALPVLFEFLKTCSAAKDPVFQAEAQNFEKWLTDLQSQGPVAVETSARRIAYGIGDLISLYFEKEYLK